MRGRKGHGGVKSKASSKRRLGRFTRAGVACRIYRGESVASVKVKGTQPCAVSVTGDAHLRRDLVGAAQVAPIFGNGFPA